MQDNDQPKEPVFKVDAKAMAEFELSMRVGRPLDLPMFTVDEAIDLVDRFLNKNEFSCDEIEDSLVEFAILMVIVSDYKYGVNKDTYSKNLDVAKEQYKADMVYIMRNKPYHYDLRKDADCKTFEEILRAITRVKEFEGKQDSEKVETTLPTPLYSKKCAYCGTEFQSDRNNKVYCNNSCQKSAKAKRHRNKKVIF
jgi:hypothetical protein